MLKRLLSATAIALFLAAVPATAQQGPSSKTVIQPCRAFDSRALPSPAPLQPGTTYQIQLRGTCGIPSNANAVSFTVHAVSPAGAGYLRIWASDLVEPTGVTLVYDNSTVSSGGESRLCAPPIEECSAVDLSMKVTYAATHVVLDITGWTQLLSE